VTRLAIRVADFDGAVCPLAELALASQALNKRAKGPPGAGFRAFCTFSHLANREKIAKLYLVRRISA
jgi:hypothetical protein